MKMRTKEEIIDSLVITPGTEIENAKLRVELCKLEVLIDIRDLLKIIADYKIEEVQGLRKD